MFEIDVVRVRTNQDKMPNPPCFVLGIETQIGLSLVRELGAAGVPVIGIALKENAIGLASRFLAAGAILRHPRTEQGLAELRDLGQRYGSGYLLTVSEANISWLIANRDKLEGITPLVPSHEAFAAVLDKERTLAAAMQVGIHVPQSLYPVNWEDVEKIASRFPFPAVLKWSNPNAILQQLKEHDIEFLKAEFVNSADEFLIAAARYKSVGVWPIVQQYCAGTGLGQFFFMHRGTAVRRFQHLRVAEWPPEGGFSSVCDAVPLTQFQELQEHSIQLLRHIGWEGIAMVEYRYDRITGKAMLMEVNGRFWGSFPLAMYCGAGFGLLAYSLQGQNRMPELQVMRDDLRCRMVSTELRRLRRIVFEAGKIRDRTFQVRPVFEVWRFLKDFLRLSVRYYVWSLRDTRPFWRDVRNSVGSRIESLRRGI